MTQTKPDQIYNTFIRTTPEKLWAAITNPEFSRQYWGHDNVSPDWKPGSQWAHVSPDTGEDRIVGKVLESTPPSRLVLSWAGPSNLADESRVTFEIKQIGDMVQLYVVHGNFQPGSKMADGVFKGWPIVLSSMKSYLETGTGLDIFFGMENSLPKSQTSTHAA